MNIAFFIKRGTKIMYRVSDSGKRFVKSTGMSCEESAWDPKKQRVIGISKRVRHINKTLQGIEERFLTLLDNSPPSLSIGDVKAHFSNPVGSSGVDGDDFQFTLLNIAERYYNGVRAGRITKRNGNRMSHKTVLSLRTTLEDIRGFVKKYGDVNLDSTGASPIAKREMVENMAFNFKNYCLTDRNLLNSSIKIKCTYIKAFLAFAQQNLNLDVDLEAARRALSVETDDHDVEIIKPELFFKIINYCLEARELVDWGIEKSTMDFVIIASKTGARVGDILSWTKTENFINESELRYRQNKKKGYKDVTIPVDPDLKKVFIENHKKYGKLAGPYNYSAIYWRLPSLLGRFTELQSQFTRVRYSGSKKVIKTGERRDFITPHVFRASLASAMLMKGIDRKTVMEITGHSSNSAAFARYENVSKEHKNKLYSEFWENRVKENY